MPLYEYRCKQCDQVFEVMQKFSDPPLTVHEECGGDVEKIVSPPAFQFKGTGWYITDYARANGANGDSKKNGTASSNGGSSEQKAETASAKTESKPSASAAN
ncbi:MAG: zinc ribbon domain-containing protein [Bryobacteraceae bacterium]|nr:zinc ribbon domain-containing protein [Bryobacteraceae bacterium]MDW8377237.1 FmdB family zinc ribbon protein [Bryobacterales bacterium]